MADPWLCFLSPSLASSRQQSQAMAASSSLLLPSLSPQIPAIASKPKTLTLALSHSTTPVSSPKPFSLSWSASNFFPVLRKSRTFGSSIARNVAVSSEFEQEEVEEEEELSSGEEVDFSPDLKLFVGNLPFSVDSAQLAGLFESAGNVEMVEVIYDKLTGKSRGFGFVTMSTVKEVEAAAQQFNGYTLEGRVLRVNSGPPPPKDDLPSRGFRTGDNFNAANRGYRTGDSFNAANRVYVGNLPWSVDNLALETLFSEQGKVMDAKVVYDRDSGRSRGFGFVSYSSEEEVKNAIASLNGVDMDGRSIRVTAAEARPRRQF